MKKQFSNKEIYSIAILLDNVFLNKNIELYLPTKVNFFLQKNIKTFKDLAQEIEMVRMNIGKKYGSFDPEKETYKIQQENIEQAQKELSDLFEIEQVINVYTIPFTDLGDTKLTTQQMQALLFMIED